MKTSYRTLAGLALIIALAFTMSCAPKANESGADVGVFVPGVASGSPIYEMLVEGARRAVASVPGATLTVVEAGYNQAEWLDKLSAMAASGNFELIVSSNPAMPELCATVAERFPATRFFVADAWLAGNPAIHTVLYNQLEQGYLVGVLAGLATQGEMKGTNPDKKVGLLVAQSYPTLDKLIAPGFSAGLAAVDPAIVLETRTIGNWYDAAKAEELTRGLFESGVDVILPIAGGAGQGALSAAKEAGRYAVWFDGPSGYALGPESVIGCATIAQDRLVEERVKALLGGRTELFGTAEALGFKDGYVGFDSSGPGFAALPESVRTRFAAAKSDLESGRVAFPITSF